MKGISALTVTELNPYCFGDLQTVYRITDECWGASLMLFWEVRWQCNSVNNILGILSSGYFSTRQTILTFTRLGRCGACDP